MQYSPFLKLWMERDNGTYSFWWVIHFGLTEPMVERNSRKMATYLHSITEGQLLLRITDWHFQCHTALKYTKCSILRKRYFKLRRKIKFLTLINLPKRKKELYWCI